MTFADPDHSESEQRFLTVGTSSANRIVIVAHTDRGENVRISVAAESLSVKDHTMKKITDKRRSKDELRREYDVPKLKTGARGKYAARYRKGTNLVVLSSDVAQYSRTSNRSTVRCYL